MATAPTPAEEPGAEPPKTRAEVFAKMKPFLAHQLGVEEDQIVESGSFTDDLGADSLDLVEVIMEMEDQFGTKISDEEAQQIKTVGQALDFICGKLDIAA